MVWGKHDTRVVQPLYDVKQIVNGPIVLHLDGTITGLGSLEIPNDFTGFKDIAVTNKCLYGINNALEVEQLCNNVQSEDLDLGNEEGVIQIEASKYHLLLLKQDGTVSIYGDSTDKYGKYKDGELWMPSGLSDVSDIACGSGYSMALKRDGSVVAWGRRIDDSWDGISWVGIDTLRNVSEIFGGGSGSYTITTEGRIDLWGNGLDHFIYDGEKRINIRDSIVEMENVLSLSKGGADVVVLVEGDSILVQSLHGGNVELIPPGLSNLSEVFVANGYFYAIEGEIPDVSIPLGVNNIQTDKFSLLFPNPSSNSIKIKEYVKGVLTLKNISGKEIFRKEISQESISIEELQPGFYLYEIIQGGEVVKQGKFIKQ